MPTREDANQRMLAIMQQHYNDVGSGKGMDVGLEIGDNSTTGEDEDSGEEADKQQDSPLPRTQRSNSLRKSS